MHLWAPCSSAHPHQFGKNSLSPSFHGSDSHHKCFRQIIFCGFLWRRTHFLCNWALRFILYNFWHSSSKLRVAWERRSLMQKSNRIPDWIKKTSLSDSKAASKALTGCYNARLRFWNVARNEGFNFLRTWHSTSLIRGAKMLILALKRKLRFTWLFNIFSVRYVSSVLSFFTLFFRMDHMCVTLYRALNTSCRFSKLEDQWENDGCPK